MESSAVPKGTAGQALQDPRSMARAGLPEAQFPGEYVTSQRKCT
jgi:hypothetical protein